MMSEYIRRTVLMVGMMIMLISGIMAQDQPADRGYQTKSIAMTFRWGEIEHPMELWASPAYFRGDVEIRKDQLPGLLQSPIQFFRNGKPIWINGMSVNSMISREQEMISIRDTTGRFPARIPNPMGSSQVTVDSFQEQRALMLTLESQQYLLDHMSEGDYFSFNNYGDRSSGMVINTMTVRIANPWEEFKARYAIPYLKWGKDDYASWQLIQHKGHKQRLRFDPSDTTNLKIRRIYQDTAKYEWVPVPSFRTAVRYLSDADLIVPPAAVDRIDTLAAAVLDPYQFEDVLVDYNQAWTVQWGDLKASFTGDYVKPDQYYGRLGVPMNIRRDNDLLPIRQARVSLVPVKGPIEQVILDGRNPDLWRQRMESVPSRTSIYFDEILVEDADGRLKLLPLQFLFNLL